MGKFNLQFGRDEFAQGEGDSIYEGGIGNDSLCNLDYKKGLLSPPLQFLDANANTTITDMRIIAYANNNAQTTDGAMCVGEEDTSSDGQIYSMNATGSGALTASEAQDTGRDYKLGITDAIFYNTKYYVTSTTDIAQMSATLTGKVFDYWTGAGTLNQAALTATVPHQMVEAQGYLYILDGNKVHRIDSSGTVINGCLTLGVDFVCMAIEVHKNKLYIYADKIKNNIGSPSTPVDIVSSTGELIIWDGTNIDTSTIERYRVSTPISVLKSFNGTLYAWDTYNLSVWNGLGLQQLKETNGYTKYKSSVAQYKDRLYYIDGGTGIGTKIVCFNGKQFYHCSSTVGLTNATYIDSIFRWKGEDLVVSTNDKTYTIALDQSATPSGNANYIAYSRFYDLPVISRIIKCLLEIDGTPSTNTSMTISAIDAKGTTTTLLTLTYAADGAITAKEVQSLTPEYSSYRLKVAFTGAPHSIKRILLTLDSTANPL